MLRRAVKLRDKTSADHHESDNVQDNKVLGDKTDKSLMLDVADGNYSVHRHSGHSDQSHHQDRHVRRKRYHRMDGEEKDEAEQTLERLVLGDTDSIIEELDRRETQNDQVTKKKKRQLLQDERKPAWLDEDDRDDEKSVLTESGQDKVRKPVLVTSYTKQRKSEFKKLTGQPSWAKLKSRDAISDSDDVDKDVEELLQKTGDFITSSTSLPNGILQYKNCPNANKDAQISHCTSLEFHPTAQVMLTAGDEALRLFQIDGKDNAHIQTVVLDKFPVHCAHFTPDGREVIMSSKHNSFRFYDMIAGKIVNVPKIKAIDEAKMLKFRISPDGRLIAFHGTYGFIHLLSAKSKELIQSVKMNGSVSAVAFSKDASTMYTHGSEGQVYIWDLSTRDCVHRFVDDGCIKGTSLACSPNGQYLACGSHSGVVNIYDENSCHSSNAPRPLKPIVNLVTPCSSTTFNHTSELLTICSKKAEKAVKLVHLPSMTTFSNFPDQNEATMRIPECVDISPHSGYLSVGTNKGLALLYRLQHYDNY